MRFDPVRFLAALLALGQAVITLLTLFVADWSAEQVVAVNGVWVGFIAVLGSFVTVNQVTSNRDVDVKVHDTIVALSQLPPASTL